MLFRNHGGFRLQLHVFGFCLQRDGGYGLPRFSFSVKRLCPVSVGVLGFIR